MNLHHSIHHLLRDIGPGYMSNTAYDTAWIARLIELGEPIGAQALEWLRENQLNDGSWGAESPAYYHDRLICTLAAATSLARYGDAHDHARLQRAKTAFETVIKEMSTESGIETIGFEMIIPTLFAEAEALGIVQRWDYGDMTRLNHQRAAKLAALPGGMINRFVTLAFSAEMAGPDGIRLLDIPNLQEINGSLAHSPSATAYYALHVCRDDPNALRYLRQTASFDGGAPDVSPFDNFERSWTLWNLRLVADLDNATIDLCQRHLDFLQSAWRPGIGVGHAAGFTPTDSDMTSVVYEVLDRFGRSVDQEAILSYEESECFRCYALEANPSVSANIHVLGALRQAGFEASHPAIRKVERFLESTQFWFDKWHVSPYYPTSHGIIACAGYLDYLAQDAINWILTTQQANGSWGYYMPTAEETAYCLQALAIWQRHGHPVPADTFKRGEEWLLEHAESPYPPLWIGKCLYCPELVVKSAILSALMLVNEGIYA